MLAPAVEFLCHFQASLVPSGDVPELGVNVLLALLQNALVKSFDRCKRLPEAVPSAPVIAIVVVAATSNASRVMPDLVAVNRYSMPLLPFMPCTGTQRSNT